MKEITLDAYGKLNLTLDILGRRPDGYHDLRMVMQSVSLCDRVTIRETENRLRCAPARPICRATGAIWPIAPRRRFLPR